MRKIFMLSLMTCLVLSLVTITSCKKFDITGTWTMTQNGQVGQKLAELRGASLDGKKGWTDIFNITFTGTVESGTFLDDFGDTGTYTVDGDNVSFIYPLFDWRFTGTASDDNTVSGTYMDYDGGVLDYIDSWSMIRF